MNLTQLPRKVCRALAGLLIGLACPALAACGDQENASYHTTTVVQTVTTTAAAAPASHSPRTSAPPQLAPYSSSIYSARVPRGWTQEANDEAHSGYVESKWRDPHDSNTSITIDASAGESKPPSSKADEVRSAVSGQPSFSEISTGSRTVAGNDGYEWTFRLSGDQRVDYFTNACDTGVAVLGSTSPGRFVELVSTFTHVADSINVDCSSPPPGEPPDFCSTHDCIANFDNGSGYIVQCNDGMWSHSGGRPGACSYHAGESSRTYP